MPTKEPSGAKFAEAFLDLPDFPLLGDAVSGGKLHFREHGIHLVLKMGYRGSVPISPDIDHGRQVLTGDSGLAKDLSNFGDVRKMKGTLRGGDLTA